MTNPAQYFIAYKLLADAAAHMSDAPTKKYVHTFIMLALTVVIFMILNQQALLQLSEEFT
jgi:hypothetical protein